MNEKENVILHIEFFLTYTFVNKEHIIFFLCVKFIKVEKIYRLFQTFGRASVDRNIYIYISQKDKGKNLRIFISSSFIYFSLVYINQQ